MALTLTYGTVTLVNSGAASGTVVAPTCNVGDLLLIVVGYGGGSPVLGASGITGGSGGTWTELSGFPQGGAANSTAITIAQKVAAASDSGATFTVNYAVATNKAVQWIVRVSDPNGTPTVGASSGSTSGAATALTTNSITVAVNSLVLAVFTGRDGATAVSYTPGTWTGTATGLTGTERDDQTNTGSSEVSAELQDGNGVVTGAGTVTALSTSTLSQAYSAGIVELVPAVAAGGGVLAPPHLMPWQYEPAAGPFEAFQPWPPWATGIPPPVAAAPVVPVMIRARQPSVRAVRGSIRTGMLAGSGQMYPQPQHPALRMPSALVRRAKGSLTTGMLPGTGQMYPQPQHPQLRLPVKPPVRQAGQRRTGMLPGVLPPLPPVLRLGVKLLRRPRGSITTGMLPGSGQMYPQPQHAWLRLPVKPPVRRAGQVRTGMLPGLGQMYPQPQHPQLRVPVRLLRQPAQRLVTGIVVVVPPAPGIQVRALATGRRVVEAPPQRIRTGMLAGTGQMYPQPQHPALRMPSALVRRAKGSLKTGMIPGSGQMYPQPQHAWLRMPSSLRRAPAQRIRTGMTPVVVPTAVILIPPLLTGRRIVRKPAQRIMTGMLAGSGQMYPQPQHPALRCRQPLVIPRRSMLRAGMIPAPVVMAPVLLRKRQPPAVPSQRSRVSTGLPPARVVIAVSRLTGRRAPVTPRRSLVVNGRAATVFAVPPVVPGRIRSTRPPVKSPIARPNRRFGLLQANLVSGPRYATARIGPDGLSTASPGGSSGPARTTSGGATASPGGHPLTAEPGGGPLL